LPPSVMTFISLEEFWPSAVLVVDLVAQDLK
jgi:hypothetical protein